MQYALGSVLYLEGHLADAAIHLTESIPLQPNQLASYYYLARVERVVRREPLDLGDHEAAGIPRRRGDGEVVEDERLALHGDVAVGVGGGAPDEGHVDGRPFVE